MIRRKPLLAQAALVAIALCDAAPGEVAIAANAAELVPAVGGGAPDWVHLMPVGAIATVDGRAWSNPDPAAVIAASRAGGRDLAIDYDHAMDLSKGAGLPAPAAGWVKDLQLRADGIWGRVEWTERGKAAVAAKEWRYLSPVFTFEKVGGRVLRILRAALTNDPAIVDLAALAARQNQTGEAPMNEATRKRLAALLGLAEAATVAEIETALASASLVKAETATATAIAQATAAVSTALAPIAKAAGLAETAKPAEIAEAVTKAIAAAGNPDPAKYVPIAVVTDLQGRLSKLESGAATATATAAVDAAMTAGKVSPAMRDWALALATKDRPAFDAFLSAQPAIVTPGRTVTGNPDADRPLDEADRAICTQMGLDPKAFAASRKDLAATVPGFAG